MAKGNSTGTSKSPGSKAVPPAAAGKPGGNSPAGWPSKEAGKPSGGNRSTAK
ncbi:MAG: hypothetical protein ORO03_06720 [Alphaproteobacteria bacterium]|nr:hypothetical protein [Alphaproteobacteria bacterium]